MKVPTSPESEFGVVGCCLLGGTETALDAVQKTTGGMFVDSSCQMAMTVIGDLLRIGQPVDLVRFSQQWNRSFKSVVPPEILSSPDNAPSASNLDYYIEQLRETEQRRKLVYLGFDLQKKANDFTIPVSEAISDVDATVSTIQTPGVRQFNATQCAQQLVDHLEARFNLNGALAGISTGLRTLDEITDGLQFGEQTIIAARPSMGKSAIGINIVERALALNVPTAVVTMEMSAASLMRRLLSSWARIPMKTLRAGTFSKEDFVKFGQFNEWLKAAPLHVVDGISGLNTAQFSVTVRQLVARHKVRLVVVDYLQKMHAVQKNEKRTYEVAEVSGTLKSVAVQTGVAMLTLAQLNREPEQNKGRIPRISDLADSGQIERDADTVILIHRSREEGQENKALLIVAKQRDGANAPIECQFNGDYCRFENA